MALPRLAHAFTSTPGQAPRGVRGRGGGGKCPGLSSGLHLLEKDRNCVCCLFVLPPASAVKTPGRPGSRGAF